MEHVYCLAVDQCPSESTIREIEYRILTAPICKRATLRVGDIVTNVALFREAYNRRNLYSVHVQLNGVREIKISVNEARMWGLHKFDAGKNLKIVAIEDKVVFIDGKPWSGIVPVLDYEG